MPYESELLASESVAFDWSVVPTEWIWAANHIERALAEVAQATPENTLRESLPPTPPSVHKTVFVAEDDAAMRQAVTTALRSGGYHIREASDGVELLDMLLEAADRPLLRPYAVVADVRMPKLSGLGVLATLRRSSWTIPVVLITALTDESVQTVARRLGAVGVLRKPFDMNDLLTAVLNAGAVLGRGHLS
jgi:CheY-like chemotaxis protein